MKNWELFVGMIALAAGMWAQVKMIAHWLKGFVIATRWVDATTAKMVTSYLISKGGKRSAPEPAYGMGSYFVKPLSRISLVAFEWVVTGGTLFWNRFRPIWIHKPKDAVFNDNNEYEFTISYLRGTVDWEELLRKVIEWKSVATTGGYKEIRHKIHFHHGKTLGSEIAEQRNEGRRGGNKDYSFTWGRDNGLRLLHWRPEDIGGNAASTTFNSLALAPNLLEMIKEVQFWHNSENWYKERGIAWRRGYLFHGLPGTGKTSMARALAEELDLPVHVVDLASMSNEDLREHWGEIAQDAPCVALIEDIDSVFQGRKNVTPSGGMMASGGLTFDSLLNCVDGVQRVDGMLLVMTTNHKEHVDPALLNRPGRIDRAVEFGLLGKESRVKIAKQILGDNAEAIALAHSSEDVPAAMFVEVCCRRALEKRYKERDEAAAKARPSQGGTELKREVP